MCQQFCRTVLEERLKTGRGLLNGFVFTIMCMFQEKLHPF